MSGGTSCKCEDGKKPLPERPWKITCWKGNTSAFNGYRKAYSEYSAVRCEACGASWRSKAPYTERLGHTGDCR